MTADRTPTTEAGRALLAAFFEEAGYPDDPATAILDIEDQARQQDSEALRLLRQKVMDEVLAGGPPTLQLCGRILAHIDAARFAAHPAPEEKP